VSIAFFFGTTAELIKLAPVIKALDEVEQPYELWNTAQHVAALRSTCDDLAIRYPDVHFVPRRRQRPVIASTQVPLWACQVLGHAVRNCGDLRRRLDADGNPPLVIVHGDTFTTLFGAIIGRSLRADVAHVEAGMRSGSLLSPLPEEFNRTMVAKLATINYAPTTVEVANLTAERAPGEIVNTTANTVVDALRLVMGMRSTIDLPEQFGLVTLHRFEFLRQADVFADTIRALADFAETYPLVMPAGGPERARISELGLDSAFGGNFQLIEKLPYARFIPVLNKASFVVTDSGGLQEECSLLGIPCCVHRERVERDTSAGENAVLTQFDLDALVAFLGEWQDYRRPSRIDEFHPTQIIMDNLRSHGYF